jgi:3-oxoacyl-[acyl-carrier protein] reductase
LENQGRFKNRVSLVTGGARGVGRAIGEAFLAEGAQVALVDADAVGLDALKNALQQKQEDLLVLTADVSQPSQVQEVLDKTLARFGRLDILVNNAGIIRRGDIDSVTEEDWDLVLKVNLKGTFLFSQGAARVMKRQGYGKIINISSIAAKTGDITSAPGYASSKAGMEALTKTFARQLAPFRINVNSLAPHAIATEMSAQWSAERRREIIVGIPLGRLGRPEEVAAATLFLASEEASFITGAVLALNGGALMD